MAQRSGASGGRSTVGPGLTRRRALQTGALGFAALAWAGASRTPWALAATAPVAPGTYAFNQNWLFGGVYTPGAELTGASETGYAPVTLPHTVVPLSWGGWHHPTWQELWIYRLTLTADVAGRAFLTSTASCPPPPSTSTAADRRRRRRLPAVDLRDDRPARPGDNVLAVTVDGRGSTSLPTATARAPRPSTICSRPASTATSACRSRPRLFVADVFAKPTNVLSRAPRASMWP